MLFYRRQATLPAVGFISKLYSVFKTGGLSPLSAQSQNSTKIQHEWKIDSV